MGIGSKIRSALSSDSASDINELNSSSSAHRHSADSGYASAANSPNTTTSRLPAGTGPGTTGKPAGGNTANVGSRRSVDASPNMRGNHNNAEAAAAGVGGAAAARGIAHEHEHEHGRHTHQRGVDGVDGMNVGDQRARGGIDGVDGMDVGDQRSRGGIDGADGMDVGGQRSRGGIIDRAEDRLERNHEQVNGGRTGDFPDPHSHGHIRAPNADIQPTGDNVHEETNHLQHVTHENVRLLETEEVVRQRDHDRHVHHVQHHVQPIHHQEVRDEVHHEMMHPVTRIHEKHANKDEDFVGLESQVKEHRDHIRHAPKERQIIDKGEIVNETTHHHVHHVIQPIIEKETLEKHRIHTVIPMHHVTHEAPIVHQSRVHEPMSMDDFLKRGHKLENGIAHHEVGRRVLNAGECEREVDGLGERIAKDLGISHGIAGHEHAARQEAGGVRGQGMDGARVGGQNGVDGARVGGQNGVDGARVGGQNAAV